MAASSDLENKMDLIRPRTAPKVRGLPLLILSFQTLGIIYSDIGTSPLYVLNGIWPSGGPVPPAEDVIGGISAIIWSLTLIPLLKYVFICLHFGTGEGEGGTFALFQGLFPPAANDLGADRVLTGDSAYKQKSTSGSAKLSERFRWPLLVWCLLGTGLTMADGIFTPAVSVTSAVGGIAVAKPSVANDIIPISIAFLVALFLAQPFGTSRLAWAFAPITFVWLLLLGSTGIANITKYPGIFRAIDISRAVMLFVRTGKYDLLSGVLLAVTGCEALFANLGQFSILSIQLSFGVLVYPCICLAYLGQGARLIVDGETVLTNVFYKTIPGTPNGPLFWIVYVFGVLATLIASQAMITATFSLVQQIVNMKSLPPIPMVHTSEKLQGQVFIPIVNWILMIATAILVGVFKNLTNLTNAYGFAVSTVMISTSSLVAVQMRYVKRLPIVVAVSFFIFYGFIDGLFWGASLRKVPQGAWVPLMLGLIMLTLTLFWTWAKGLEDKFDGANRRNLRHFIITNVNSNLTLPLADDADTSQDVTEKEESETASEQTYYYIAKDGRNDTVSFDDERSCAEKRELVRIPTCAVFYKVSGGRGVPHSFVSFVRQWPALPRVVIFLSVSVLAVPRVPAELRYVVDKVRSIEGFYGVTYYLGFREKFSVEIHEVVEKICALQRPASEESFDTIKAIRQVASTTIHIVPYYYVTSKRSEKPGFLPALRNWTRGLLIDGIYRIVATMFPETVNWAGSADEIIRVGINAVI